MFSKKEINEWKERGLKISQIKRNPDAILSPGNKWWVDATDRYIPTMSENEVQMYYNNPKKFADDFVKNVALYISFLNFLISKIKEIQNVTAAQVTILFHLFQSGMDNHYYYFDRHLEYTDSDKSPVGIHWLELNKKVAELRPELSENERKALAFDLISGKEQMPEVQKNINAIKIFQEVQEKEIQMTLLNGIQIPIVCGTAIKDLIKGKVNLFLDNELPTLVSDTRKLLDNPRKYLSEEDFSDYKQEIACWI